MQNTVTAPSIQRLGDTFVCSGIEPTFVPAGGAHVRQAFIKLPVRFVGRPVVTALVHPRDAPASAGAAFVIFNITVTPIGETGTQIKISATNNAVGVPVDGLFECDYIITGRGIF
ncbi:hypothetical protein AB5J62_17645 [Amycolatopsis sp. cg5]|uniref:hypothetical protein n=1 Tax=Amycolatopsis sp. cg5 TaxID=3238802 RepID=UPI0035261DAD